MILPDVNVLIYAFRKDVPQHAVCRPWLVDLVESDARFGLSPLALSAVVRITTNPSTYWMPSSFRRRSASATIFWRNPTARSSSRASGTGISSSACASRLTRAERA
jgi:predicted nucleic acid-binding protein